MKLLDTYDWDVTKGYGACKIAFKYRNNFYGTYTIITPDAPLKEFPKFHLTSHVKIKDQKFNYHLNNPRILDNVTYTHVHGYRSR